MMTGERPDVRTETALADAEANGPFPCLSDNEFSHNLTPFLSSRYQNGYINAIRLI